MVAERLEGGVIIGLIQVRMGSTRLPGKALRQIAGQPMLWHVIHRVRAAQRLDGVCVATSVNPLDDPIEKLACAESLPVYRGSETDVLDRLYQAARWLKATAVVRVTGDCPLVDPALIDRLVEFHLQNADKYDCVSNVHPPTFPDGLDLELIPFTTLQAAWKETKDAFDREWAMRYIFENPRRFRVGNLANAEDLSALRWTVDHEEDIIFMEEIFSRLGRGGRIFHMEEVLELLEREPALGQINAMHGRNEAYHAALRRLQAKERK